MLDFNQFEFLSFDCYGTLIDWESGILTGLKTILSSHKITQEIASISIDDEHLLDEVRSSGWHPDRDAVGAPGNLGEEAGDVFVVKG